jgi:hypothetical protein
MTEIRHLARQAIDTVRWDRCVSASGQGIAFGYSRYLDLMADDWDGLVVGDYEAVLPLPARKKFGVRYGYPPRFMGPNPVYCLPGTIPPLMDLMHAAGCAFRFSDIQVAASPQEVGIPHAVRKNHLLPLDGTYDAIRSGYSATCRNLLSKGEREGVVVDKGGDSEEAIRRAVRDGMMEGCSRSDLDRFRMLCRERTAEGSCFTASAKNKGGDPLSMGIFLIAEKRVHYMASWTGEAGRKTGASRLVIDSVVREFAGTGRALDFVGSDIPGIASFFEGFGARAMEYVLIRQNRLPPWIGWMKPPLTGTYDRNKKG